MSKIRAEINVLKILDKVIEKQANDDTSLEEFSRLIERGETIKKVIKPENERSTT